MGGELYGEERFITKLKADSGETLQMACANAIHSLMDFGNGQQAEDDLTLLGIEFRSPRPLNRAVSRRILLSLWGLELPGQLETGRYVAGGAMDIGPLPVPWHLPTFRSD